MGPRAAALAAALAASLQAPAASCPDPDKGGHLTLNASTWTLPCPPRAPILSALHLWGGHCPLPCRSLMCTPNQPTPPAPPPGCTPNLSISCSPALSQHRLPPCTGEPGRGTGHMTLSHQRTSRGRPGGGARPPPSALALRPPPSHALWAARSSAPVFFPAGSSSDPGPPPASPPQSPRRAFSCPSPAQVPSRSPGRGPLLTPLSSCPSPVTPPAP